jgi:hypothetical protein
MAAAPSIAITWQLAKFLRIAWEKTGSDAEVERGKFFLAIERDQIENHLKHFVPIGMHQVHIGVVGRDSFRDVVGGD